MNKCHFLGKLVQTPTLQTNDFAKFTRFFLEIEEYRKDKDGNKRKRKDILEFEAWDSAAIAITTQSVADDYMVVEAIARKDNHNTIFRVTTFKIFVNQKNFEN